MPRDGGDAPRSRDRNGPGAADLLESRAVRYVSTHSSSPTRPPGRLAGNSRRVVAGDRPSNHRPVREAPGHGRLRARLGRRGGLAWQAAVHLWCSDLAAGPRTAGPMSYPGPLRFPDDPRARFIRDSAGLLPEVSAWNAAPNGSARTSEERPPGGKERSRCAGLELLVVDRLATSLSLRAPRRSLALADAPIRPSLHVRQE